MTGSLSLGARESDDRVEESPKGEKRVAGLNHPHRGRATQTPDDTLAPPARQLLALVDPARHGVGEATAPQRPSIPLASPHLLINGPRDHTVSSEIKRELASADRVDLLVSFLKFSGWCVEPSRMDPRSSELTEV